MLQAEKKFYTADEYFAFEEQTEYRSEFYHGELFAMAGGSLNHNRITNDFAGSLNAAFTGTSCEAFTSDLRVQIDRERHYAYPDVLVVCGKVEFDKKHKSTVTNPALIAEVLSDSTQDYDRGSKFMAYRNFIPSLRDYLLIEQKRVHVEHFTKEADSTWRLREFFSLEDALTLEFLTDEIPLQAIYKRVRFEPNLYPLHPDSPEHYA